MTVKKPRWGRLNLYAMMLQWAGIDDPAFEHIVRAIAQEIRQAGARAELASDAGHEEWADAVIDTECNLTDNLLGVAYVLCQAQITRVMSSVIHLHGVATGEKPPVALATTEGTKNSILKFGASASTSPCKIVVLDAFANYYKHESEWHGSDWAKLKGVAKNTAKTIKEAGASSGSTGNLRRGFEYLTGHPSYEKVEELAQIVTKWKKDLLREYRAELSGLGLMK